MKTAYMPIRECIGQYIRHARKSQGLTQTQVGRLLGLSRQRVSEYERNPGAMTVDELLHLSAALDLAVHLGPKEDTFNPPPGSPEW